MPDNYITINLTAASDLAPGDHVLLTCSDQFPDGIAAEVQGALKDKFPGVDFTVVSGITGVHVLGAPPEEQDCSCGSPDGGHAKDCAFFLTAHDREWRMDGDRFFRIGE